jgi:hypothetical protein
VSGAPGAAVTMAVIQGPGDTSRGVNLRIGRYSSPRGYRYALTTYCCTMRWVLKKAPLMAMAPYMARIKARRSR